MAHSTLHFSLGMIAGTAISLPSLVRAWRQNNRLSIRFLTWFLVSYGLGVYAVVPGLLRRLGLPDAFCDGSWMNAFLFYPLLNVVKPGALTSGPLTLAACFAFQYGLLLLALFSKYRKQMRGASDQEGPQLI